MLKPFALLVALALPAAASGQQLFKCIDAKGRVTYQEVPCAFDKAQKRVDTSHAGQPDAERIADEAIARRTLEAREEADLRDKRYRQEQRERQEKIRKELEQRPKVEEPWNPPWGFPARPGQARKPDPDGESKPKPDAPR